MVVEGWLLRVGGWGLAVVGGWRLRVGGGGLLVEGWWWRVGAGGVVVSFPVRLLPLLCP